MPSPILSVAAMRAWEAATWAAGIEPEGVIRRAGVAVADAARRMTAPEAPVLVLAGRGNNGADAQIAAGELSDRATTLISLEDPTSFESAGAWLQRHAGRGDALVVDGMFGIGLNRPLAGAWAEIVEAVNRSGLRVLAVDVPSGLDADHGEIPGCAIRAARTLTLGGVKRGLLRERVSEYVGRLEVASEIGLVSRSDAGAEVWIERADFDDYPPRRVESGHKGTFGHVTVVAGSWGFHGAAVLAARGAMRARPGLVSVVTEDRCYFAVASQLGSAMVRTWGGEVLDMGGSMAWVVGPGLASPSLSPRFRDEMVRIWCEAEGPVVVDASALDWLPKGGRSPGIRVITPHPGEAGRLLEADSATIQDDRFEAARRLRERWENVALWVVLKGRHTIVAGPDGTVRVNSSGNAGLAQGGSGDVLAGYLGGLVAQSALRAEFGRTLSYGVWRHGATADVLESACDGWTTEDLADALRVRP